MIRKFKKQSSFKLTSIKRLKIINLKHITLINNAKISRLKILEKLKKHNIFINWAYDPLFIFNLYINLNI